MALEPVDDPEADAALEDDIEAPALESRSTNLALRKKIRDRLLDGYKHILKGFDDQFGRSSDIEDFWDIYHSRLGSHQYYQGNANIFMPIVYEAVRARVTRFTNQIFPSSQRYVECTSSDGTIPSSIVALAEHYARRARLRDKLPALLVNGDVEGQFSVYVYWNKATRHVVTREMVPEGNVPGAPEIEDIVEQEIESAHPAIEIIADADILVLPATAESINDALQSGGSVTIIRRWSKAKLEQLIDDDEIDGKLGRALIEELSNDAASVRPDKEKKMVDAAGIRSDGRGKYALLYETWGMVKTSEGRRLCRTYYASEDKILSCKRNPYWNDRCPLISAPSQKAQGSFKGRSLIAPVADLQYFANDTLNEAADSAAYAMLPIVMTDPEKNPRTSSMVMSLAAVWLTNPNDTKFATFPQLWRDGMEIVAALKQEIFQTLSVNPAMIAQGAKKKLSQAEVANEQQVDILTTADAVTTLESAILTPLISFFIELDHQYRDADIMVRSYGSMGKRANMETVKPLQMNNRYEFRWFGVEQARNVQQVQQQIAALNVIKGIPPQLYQGYKLNAAPFIAQLAENAFGPRLGPLIFEDLRSQIDDDPKLEVEMAVDGIESPVHPLGNHQMAMQLLGKALQATRDPTGVIRTQLMKHQAILMEQAQAQAQAMQPKGQPGGPGGAGPGVAGGPRPGAQPAPQRPAQQPPGAIHRDQMPLAMPRRA